MLLLRNAEVYAPAPLGVCDVLVCHDKIVEIGKKLKPSIGGITEIDASGKRLVPGFLDQHVHVTGGGGEGGFHTRPGEIALSTVIRAGVTTLVGLLGTDSFTRSVENLVAKTIALSNEGLTTFCLTGAYRFPSDTVTGSVAKDIVFIDKIIGCKLAISDHRCSHPTREEIIRLVSDVRMASLVAGKPGVLHVHTGGSAESIDILIDIAKTTDIPIWHFRPTHLGRRKDKAVEFTKLGGYADITAKPNEDFAREFLAIIKEAAPGLITLSSDSNGSFPIWNEHREIIGMGAGKIGTLYDSIRALVLGCGLPLEEALPYITVNVAKALRLYPAKGTIEAGSDADLVLLDKELLVDSVIAKGKPMMMEKEVLVKGTFED